MSFVKINRFSTYAKKLPSGKFSDSESTYRLVTREFYINTDSITSIQLMDERSETGEVLFDIYALGRGYCISDEESVNRILGLK